MRDLTTLNRHRLPNLELEWVEEIGAPLDRRFGGIFALRSPIDGKAIRIIATAGDDWDHLSVSLINRCPRWSEMEFVKRLFFEDHETAMQLHVPPADHVNYHPFCLHLWRPQHVEIPRPPAIMVGPPKQEEPA